MICGCQYHEKVKTQEGQAGCRDTNRDPGTQVDSHEEQDPEDDEWHFVDILGGQEMRPPTSPY